MQKHDGGLTFSATDLCNHLECAHLTSLALTDLETPLTHDEADEEAELWRRKGEEHERLYFDLLRTENRQIADLRGIADGYEVRQQATLDAMKSGVDVIYQAFLWNDPFIGYSDFLMRTDSPSQLGTYSYEVLDTKLARHSKPYYMVQLCLYSELLESLQGIRPTKMHVVLGDRRQESFFVKDFWYYFNRLKSQFLKEIKEGKETYPDPCAYCPTCQYRTLCDQRRLEDDHLWQVANIRQSQIRRLSAVGVSTLAGLADFSATHVKGIGNETLSRLKQQSKLQQRKKATGKDQFVVLPPQNLAKGLHRLPWPDPGDLFFDIEGDPLYPNGLEYLFGVVYSEKGQEQFLDLWSHNHQQEKEAFESLIRFFIERFAKYPAMHIYHYASYEETALKRLMARYGSMEAEVDHLLRNQQFVDLFAIVRHSLQTSEPAYSLKNLERFYMPDREAQIKTAGASIVYYEKYVMTGEPKYLDEIRSYNRDDCQSLRLLRDWLVKLQMERPDDPHPGTMPEDTTFKADRDAEQLEGFRTALAAGLPDEGIELTSQQRVDRLVLDLVEFYRREARPSWWRMFSRQTMTSEELIDDVDCIGGLELDKRIAPIAIDKSMLYTFTFPDQESKLRIGDRPLIAETLKSAGEIVSLDDEKGIIQLKRGKKLGEPPKALDLIPGSPVPTDALKTALWRFISSYVADKAGGQRSYPAICDLLERRLPRIQGIESGKPICDATTPSLQDYKQVVSRLEESYLFIQGPPGTGKTYTASHLIVHLMKEGYRVGVMANSHKVIYNLLKAVEEQASKAKFSFRGIHKSSWSSREAIPESVYFDSTTKKEEVFQAMPGVQLVSGTAWLFAELGDLDCIEYLFIDEAGQVSLANFIAAATAAKNIVLIGDQMQLAQPIQGVHPGEAGQSVLDYLLQGRHTIPHEAGILLNTTYRMHPDICDFISEAVYDGRIMSQPGLENQAIIGGAITDKLLPAAGIVCHLISHEGCVQRSDEEAEFIRDLCASLIKAKYRDKSKSIYPISWENTMVVSPYNAQVNNLRRILDGDARVGTVDKFQGQEAEVVIVSMATSDPDGIPRGLDFLYSQNRLNVSISRAKTLSIIVMSSQLLDVRCNTVDQMRLVNTLCWVEAYSSQGIDKVK